MNFNEAVQQISDVLSEGISKITLFILTLKQNNLAAPPALQNAIQVISGHVIQLVGLANSLSNGYEDYPSIQAAIRAEAAALDSSEKNLSSSCRSLQGNAGSSELAASWERVSGSCKSMAEAIVELLKILYLAEVNRILIVNESLQKAGKEAIHFPMDTMMDNQQVFADAASDSATFASHLSQFLNFRAQTDPSPSHQSELKEYITVLDSSAQEIMNLANDCLDEPEDLSRQRDFKAANQNAMDKASVIIQSIQDIEKERNFARFTPTELELAAVVTQDVPSSSNDPNSSATPSVIPSTTPSARKTPSAQPKPTIAAPHATTPEYSSKAAPTPTPTPKAVPTPSATPKTSVTAKASSSGNARRSTPVGNGGKGAAGSMDAVAEAARDMAEKSGTSGITSAAGELQIEIEKLAKAANEGDGAELLRAARAVAAITSKFSKDVKKASSQCSNPSSKETIGNDAKYLGDLCIQLKILATVKASACDSNVPLSNDEQLVYLTGNLVKMWQKTSDDLSVSALLK